MASRLACFFVAKGVTSEEDKEVYQYGLGLIFSTTLNILIVLTISLFFHKFWGTVMFLLAFIPLRKATGGYHADSYLKCGLTFLAVYILCLLTISYVPINILVNAAAVFSIIAIGLVLKYAPVEHKNKPLSIEQKKRLRKKSIILIFSEITLFFVGLMLFSSVTKELILGMMGIVVAVVTLAIGKGGENNENNVDESYGQLR